MIDDGREIERLLTEVASPLIRQILARHFRAGGALPRHDAEDVAATVKLRLLHKLRNARSPDEAIQDVDKYVATMTYNVINDQLRRRFPERTRHKNRVLYVLGHDARLAMWSVPAGLAAGLRAWSGSHDVLTVVTLDESRATRRMLDRNRSGDALNELFEHFGRAIELDALLELTAALWHVVDAAPAEMPDIIDAQDPVPAQMERKQFLRRLWSEIRELRPMQRQALLLNLRDPEAANAISLLVLTGVAPFDEIAAALEISGEELAAIWNELPLDDLRIAERLGVTRQQVINLRKSARERLARRLYR